MIEYWKRNTIVCMVVLVTAASSGCMAGRGVLATRQPFNEAVQHTAKQEMLLNIVRLKYREPPEFMQMGSINESLSYSSNGGAGFDPFRLTGWNIGASTSESPNFTYTPLESDEFNRRLINPIPRDVLDLLGATNWSVGQLLRLTIKNINDVDNASNAGGPTPEFAPEFEEFKLATLMLDELHANRKVEITHVSAEDELAGLDEKRVTEFFHRVMNQDGNSISAADRKEFDKVLKRLPETMKKKAEKVAGEIAKKRPELKDYFDGIVATLTKSSKVQPPNVKPDASNAADETSSLVKKLVQEITEGISPTDSNIPNEYSVTPEPLVKKLFGEIREGLTAPIESAAGQDQVAIRFDAEELQSIQVQTIREIFHLVEADPSYPFYNFQRADWGQLRRRDSQRNQLNTEVRLWGSTRSFLEVMYFVSQGICVPQEHIDKGLVTVTRNYDGTVFDWTQVTGDLLNVCVSKRKPKNASTAVQYRGHWYYIRDNDLKSKSTFSLLTQTYNMAVLSGAVGMVPQLTISR